MRRFPVKQNSLPSQPAAAPTEGAAAEFDIERLLANCAEVLRREVANLLMESSRGKLGATSARDLASYIKLLNELKHQAKEDLANMTDEQLEALKG